MAARDPALRRAIASRAGRSNVSKHGPEHMAAIGSLGGKAFVRKYGTDPRDRPWWKPRT